MQKFASLLFLFILLAFTPCSSASESQYMEMVERFFKAVSEGEVAEGVDKLYSSNPWMERKKDAIGTLRSGLVALPESVGQFQGYELVVTKFLTHRLIYLNYFVVYDRQPMRFEFQFYRPDKKWIIFSLSFDDFLDDELKERGRSEALQDEWP